MVSRNEHFVWRFVFMNAVHGSAFTWGRDHAPWKSAKCENALYSPSSNPFHANTRGNDVVPHLHSVTYPPLSSSFTPPALHNHAFLSFLLPHRPYKDVGSPFLAFLAQTKVRFPFEPHFAITEATYTRFERPNALLSFPYRVPRSLRMRVPPPFHRIEHCMECGCSGEAEDRDDRAEALRRGHLDSLPLLAGVIRRSASGELDIQATDAGRREPVPARAGLSHRRRVHSV